MKRALIILAVILLGPSTAIGVSDSDWSAINSTQSTFYNENDSDLLGFCGGNTGGSGVAPSPTNDNELFAYNYFTQTHGLAPFRAAAIMGNLMQESHVNPADDNPAAKGGGGGIAQWEGARWTNPRYPISESTPGLLQYADAKNTSWQNLQLQLDFMWLEATSTHENALAALKGATDITTATEQWEKYYEGAGIPMMQNRIQFAKDALADPRMGNNAPATGAPDGSVTTPAPGSDGSAGNPNACATTPGNTGGIVGTALSQTSHLAWPKPDCTQTAYGETRTGCDKSSSHPWTDEYHKANVNPGGFDPFTDCGTFVSTVMHVSGADPHYPVVTTTVQRDYVEAHTTLYHVIPHPNAGQLQPGDILISDGHTMIYVGDAGKPYTRVDASWHDHTPQLNTAGGVVWMLGQPGIVLVRYIGNSAKVQ